MKNYLFLLVVLGVGLGLGYIFSGASAVIITISLCITVACLVAAYRKVGMPPVSKIIKHMFAHKKEHKNYSDKK